MNNDSTVAVTLSKSSISEKTAIVIAVMGAVVLLVVMADQMLQRHAARLAAH